MAPPAAGFGPLRWAALALLAWSCPALSAEQPAAPEKPTIEDLGGQRYRIGPIEVDRARQRFTVPGRVIDLGSEEAPLEFAVIIKGGGKDYESLVEIEADAYQFNLACILIGLEEGNAVRSSARFDPTPVEGDGVALWLSWQENGKVLRKKLSEIMRLAGEPSVPDDWVYTGSFFWPDGRYAAQSIGLLIGFVHDPESVIQHRSGLGLGNYGAVTYRRAAGPPPGAPIELIVERLEK